MVAIKGNNMKFELDTEQIWLYKLNKEMETIKGKIEYELHSCIKNPLISLPDMNSLWGQWCPEQRTIKISTRLLRHYEWGAVSHVIKHEFAHLIVDEVFKMSLPGVSHGEAFKKACDSLGIDANRCSSHSYLASYKTLETDGLVDKVRKLLTKGNCYSLNKVEADLFLNKAREIMVRYNINMSNVCGNDRFWVTRPVGPLYKNVPRYIYVLRNIVEDFYFVKTIGTYAYVYINGRRIHKHYTEMFGEVHNIELAEYVYNALLSNAELLWKEFVVEHKSKGESIRGVYHKNNFIKGLLNGYSSQLRENDAKIIDKDTEALIHINDPLLDELFKKQYPRISYGRSYYDNRSGGYSSGLERGKKMRISQGVAVGSRGNLLSGK